MSERTETIERENNVAGNADTGSGDGGGGVIYFDPSSALGNGADDTNQSGTETTDRSENGSGGARRRRGRPPGSGAKSRANKQATASDDLAPEPKRALEAEGIAAILLSMHTMMASFIKVPELAIDPEEANKLGAAMADVSRQYNVKATEKTLAWTHLATTCAMVYGTRLFAYKMRKDLEQKETTEKKGNVIAHPAMNMGM